MAEMIGSMEWLQAAFEHRHAREMLNAATEFADQAHQQARDADAEVERADRQYRRAHKRLLCIIEGRKESDEPRA